MDSSTTTIKKQDKSVPWFISKQNNPDKQAFIKAYQDKEKHQVIKDMFLPAMYKVGEIIYSNDTPAQTALQGCQLIINKVIGDKIEITQQKQIVDVNKLIDQAMAIRSITQENISKSDEDSIIDVSPISEDACK